jgi:hypothetical protein
MTSAAVTSIARTESLSSLLRRGASQRAIAAHLEALAPYSRMQEVLGVTGELVGKLYDAVAGAPPLTLGDLVPQGETGTVILEGRNSLPTFSRFQKRFARVGDKLVGYNHQTWSFVTGPGYFVVQPPTPGETHPDELFFDYTSDPPRDLPAGWPAFSPNSAGLSRLVYMHMKDFCRRVADGVLVGKAYKLGVAQGAYFTLSRPY